MEDTKPKTGHKKIIALYAAFILALLGQLVPAMQVQLGSALLFLVLLGVTGHLRREAEKGSLLHNHCVYLSRTIWVWSVLLMICMAAAGYYTSTQYTMNEFLEISQSLSRENLSSAEVRKFGMIGVMAALPGILYLVYRVLKGLLKAVRGEALSKPDGIF